MDTRVIQAVAGSGKTTYVVESIDSARANLVLTYTENNYRNLRNRIVRQFGGIPDRTRIYTYFSFLYTFCLRPLCGDKYGLRGINFDNPPDFTRRIKRDNLRHYINSHGRIYASRVASFLINFDLVDEVRERVEKYFQCIYVDEVQDFAGHDFNLLALITMGNTDSLLVGDFFQHTYDTSRDGGVNKGLHDDYISYKKKLESLGFEVDETVLSHSYRCRPTTCEFVSNYLGIGIYSHLADASLLEFVDDEGWAEALFHQDYTVKLFYQSHLRYPCFSDNWGASKGIDDYDSVCVVLNKKSEDLYRKGELKKLPAITKNKLYVACTRARSELYLVPEHLVKKFKQGG